MSDLDLTLIKARPRGGDAGPQGAHGIGCGRTEKPPGSRIRGALACTIPNSSKEGVPRV